MKKVLLLMLTASALLGACKKDKDDSNPANGCKIVKFTPSGGHDYVNSEYLITYNSDGKISTITNADETRRFSYESSKMLVSVDNLLITYNYNSPNQINSIITNSQWPENVSVTYADNKVSKILTSVDDISSTFTYSSNEVVKILEKWGDTDTEEALITYKEEKYSNPLIFELIFPSMIDGDIRNFIRYNLSNSFGASEKRLIDKIEYIGKGDRSYNTRTDTYSYLKDDKGNIIQIIITSTSYTTRSFTLEYSCN
ncbi:hypothetical protein FYC62_14975 [Pedobacter aquae]|uniref:DUF4595 domain-containing protein n=1 Tax=Pedobacter aquae TaxID=2605747 RepID=A0A5C0VMI5_9SPHI|nr:hypothetical protein [Pedobacter aquae]QEK52821.1 hypothetical protein FYC62_14975 [Pedobacter aquae]